MLDIDFGSDADLADVIAIEDGTMARILEKADECRCRHHMHARVAHRGCGMGFCRFDAVMGARADLDRPHADTRRS
jgi:hypothetical protein